MSYCPWLALVLGGVAGCGGDEPTSPGTSGGDTDTDADSDADADTDADTDNHPVGDDNDDFASADAVFQDTPVDGAIDPAGDVDVYAYESTGAEWLRVQTVDDGDTVDTFVSVYTPGGKLHAYMDDYATGSVSGYDTVLYVYLPTAGTWYVAVEDVGSVDDGDELEPTGGPTSTYELTISEMSRYTAEVDSEAFPSAEADLADADSVVPIGVVVDQPGDVDYIPLTIPWDLGPIEIYGQPIPDTDATSRVDVYSAVGEPIAAQTDLGNHLLFYASTEAGTYSVQATDANGDGGDNAWYVLYFVTRMANEYGLAFDAEPNDVAEVAQGLETETRTTDDGTEYEAVVLEGTLDVEGDEDWYAVNVPAGDYLTLWCTADGYGSLLDPQAEVYGPSGDLLGAGTDGNDAAPDLDNLGPVDTGGTVLIRLWAEGGTTSGPGAWYYCAAYATPFEVSG